MLKLIHLLSNYKNHYFSSILVLLFDTNIAFMSSFFVVLLLQLMLNFEFSYHLSVLWVFVGVAASVFSFCFTKTYRIVIRHMSLADMFPFFIVPIAKVFCLLLVFLLINTKIKPAIIVAISVIDGTITFTALVVFRVILVAIYDYFRLKTFVDKRMNVMIFGTTNKSVSFVKSLENSQLYCVRGFISDEQNLDVHTIAGTRVIHYEGVNTLEYLMSRGKLDAILVPNETTLIRIKDTIVVEAMQLGVKILLSPSIDEAKNGVIFRDFVREIKIEDLLGRQEIVVDVDVIRAYFVSKIVMVTGAAGSIGSELCRQLATFGIKKLVLFDNAETPLHYLRLELESQFPDLDFAPIIGDVRFLNRLDFVFHTYKPDVVFHAAAYKHVPLMENNPCEAVMVNVSGTKNVADKCIEYGVERMVMISTDKAVNPTNVMGCSKRISEIYVQSLGNAIENGEIEGKTVFVTTRFGNVLGSNGSVVPRFKEQIAKGGPVTVTHPDINRFFMTIPEACRLVMEAATLTTGNQIFVFDMGKPVKIVDLARNMIRLAGLKPDQDINIEYTGLRPGEKLYEEVLANEENTIPTTNRRIRIAKVRPTELKLNQDYCTQLIELSSSVNIPELLSLMKTIVPEYTSQS